MIYSQFLVSLILIVSGFLVKRFPNLIAGYNTLSKTDKEKINIKELSTFLKYTLICLGLLTLLLYYVLDVINVKENTIILFNTTLIVVIVIVATYIANTRFKN